MVNVRAQNGNLVNFLPVDPLAWLGLKKKGSLAHLSEIQQTVRTLLPDDESVVIRYIVIVAILLTKIAHADGRLLECELAHLRALFEHIDRIPPEGMESLFTALNEHVPQLADDEIALCYQELKSLCDGSERLAIMRLLASQAGVDGNIVPSEHAELMAIAYELGIPATAMKELELEALTTDVLAHAQKNGSAPQPPVSDPSGDTSKGHG